jgi:hypothetical protein
MEGNTQQHSDPRFGNAWRGFVREVRSLLMAVTAPQRLRYLDQFLQLRNATLDAAESEEVVYALQRAWDTHATEHGKQAAELLLMELLAFPPAAEVARQMSADNEMGSSPRGLMSVAKTIVGSVRDVLGDLMGPLAKGILTAFSELLELLGC